MLKKISLIFFLFIFSLPSLAQDEIQITVLYDNLSISDSLENDWGFACLIETPIKKILFDTGRDPEILKNNFLKLKKDDSVLDNIVISHNHLDHTGGLEYLIDKNIGSTVFFPDKENKKFSGIVNAKSSKPVPVDKAIHLSHCVSLTGQMKSGFLIEQSIIIETVQGLVILTGCAHQGIIKVAKKAKDLFGKDINLILGGFHLSDASNQELKNIVNTFKELGVKKIAPSHCTGEKVLKFFKNEYGENFIESGVGASYKFNHAKRNLY